MPSEIVARFAAEHFVLNSISESRQEQVLSALARYERFLNSTPIEGADDRDLRGYLVTLLNEGLCASTVAYHQKTIMPFYQWCWRSRVIEAEALMRLRDVSPPRGYNTAVPRPYSRKELAQMWEALDAKWPYTSALMLRRWANGTSPFRGRLRRHAMRLQLDAIIELALVCGLRRNEIYRLAIDDVHWDNAYIVVYGKRVDQHDKVREVPYPDSTRTAIEAWLRCRAQLGPQDGLPIWLSVTGPDPAAGLNTTRMRRILRSFGRWELHRLRHTCATERLRAGMPLEQLQQFLGHASLRQTLAYAQIVKGDVHTASERIDADFQRAIRRAA